VGVSRSLDGLVNVVSLGPSEVTRSHEVESVRAEPHLQAGLYSTCLSARRVAGVRFRDVAAARASLDLSSCGIERETSKRHDAFQMCSIEQTPKMLISYVGAPSGNPMRWRQRHEKKRFFNRRNGSATWCLSGPRSRPDGPALERSPLDSQGTGNTFSVLLSGLYKPVVDCPTLDWSRSTSVTLVTAQ